MQGCIGKLLALNAGVKPQIANVIEEHYFPKFTGDKLPNSRIGIVLSLADKLDTVITSFINNIIPTGSQDPWGLRREVLSILQIFLQLELDLGLKEAFNSAYNNFVTQSQKSNFVDASLCVCPADLYQQLYKFTMPRVAFLFSAQNLSSDIIDAVSEKAFSNLKLAFEIAKFLSEEKKQAKFRFIQETAIRVKRIIKNSKQELDLGGVIFPQDIENQLLNQYSVIYDEISKNLNNKNFFKVYQILEDLASIVEKYFEQVLVMSEDLILREQRLSLLAKINRIFMQFCDWEKFI